MAALVVGGMFAWGPVSAALFPKGRLADAAYYDMAIRNLEELRSPDIPAIAYPGTFDNFRVSPGYRDAINEYIDAELAKIDGDMTFDSPEAADEYSYSTLYAHVVDIKDQLIRGGLDTPLATQSFPQDADILALEQEITAIPVVPGADGTYWETANRIAAVVGSTTTQDLSLSGCVSGINEITEAAASFCAQEESWDYIFFYPPGVESQYTEKLVNTTKHEVAHKLIHVQCLNAFSPLTSQWNERIGEGVTNSYAVLYLGADAADMSVEDDYAMTPETDALARAVHDGDLACYDNAVLPGR
ncbi:hypothetical protein [uncultured Microbacterium sp.]|uniref:hypothetical protein n=1 Tax=uncultured Microbacterium sp. TaxID=191216 RepID=UPI0025DB3651|nr:hypothetical protein [uncultured Microbacterium sp.]